MALVLYAVQPKRLGIKNNERKETRTFNRERIHFIYSFFDGNFSLLPRTVTPSPSPSPSPSFMLPSFPKSVGFTHFNMEMLILGKRPASSVYLQNI